MKSKIEAEPKGPYSLYDFQFPAGIISRLAKIHKLLDIVEQEYEPLYVILKRFKFDKPQPVVILAGSHSKGRESFLGGIANAAKRTDAIIIDSGINSGVEKSCIRNKTDLLGVFIEKNIVMPQMKVDSKNKTKIDTTKIGDNEVSNGHTHMVMICDEEYQKAGQESSFVMKIAEFISRGSKDAQQKRFNPCKQVLVLMGDDESCLNLIKYAVQKDLPIIVVGGSDINEKIIKFIRDKESFYNEPLQNLIEMGKFYILESKKSNDLAAFVHFFLTVTPWGEVTSSKKDEETKGKEITNGNE